MRSTTKGNEDALAIWKSAVDAIRTRTRLSPRSLRTGTRTSVPPLARSQSSSSRRITSADVPARTAITPTR